MLRLDALLKLFAADQSESLDALLKLFTADQSEN